MGIPSPGWRLFASASAFVEAGRIAERYVWKRVLYCSLHSASRVRGTTMAVTSSAGHSHTLCYVQSLPAGYGGPEAYRQVAVQCRIDGASEVSEVAVSPSPDPLFPSTVR